MNSDTAENITESVKEENPQTVAENEITIEAPRSWIHRKIDLYAWPTIQVILFISIYLYISSYETITFYATLPIILERLENTELIVNELINKPIDWWVGGHDCKYVDGACPRYR